MLGVARAKREMTSPSARANACATSALVALWRTRAEALTRDLDVAKELFMEMKRELAEARARGEDAKTNALAHERQFADINAKLKATEGEVEEAKALAREMGERAREEGEARERAEAKWRESEDERRALEDAHASERAREREDVEVMRARAEHGEKRAGKAEKAARAAQEEGERVKRELAGELERERAAKARLEEERVDLEVDRRRFRDFDALIAQERIKVVEAHSSAKIATDASREQARKAEDEAAQLRRTLESRSAEMANAVRTLNEELAVQHDVVERGMSARVDALRDAFEEELQRAREKSQAAIDEGKMLARAQEERIEKLEANLSRAENVSREALARLKSVIKESSSLTADRDALLNKLHALGELNSKLTRRIIDGGPFVHDDELTENGKVREEFGEMNVTTPSPARKRSVKSRRVGTPVARDLRDVQRIQEELERELAELRLNHDAISREIRQSSADDGQMLIRALEDASTRMSAKARQIKMLNTTLRTSQM